MGLTLNPLAANHWVIWDLYYALLAAPPSAHYRPVRGDIKLTADFNKEIGRLHLYTFLFSSLRLFSLNHHNNLRVRVQFGDESMFLISFQCVPAHL